VILLVLDTVCWCYLNVFELYGIIATLELSCKSQFVVSSTSIY